MPLDKDPPERDDLPLRPLPCPFEKTLQSGAWSCAYAEKYLVAEREGMNCREATACADCKRLLAYMTAQSRFALGLTDPHSPLSHGQAMKLRNGLLRGLAQLRGDSAARADIHCLVHDTLDRYGDLQTLPLTPLLKSIAESRRR